MKIIGPLRNGRPRRRPLRRVAWPPVPRVIWACATRSAWPTALSARASSRSSWPPAAT
ncbi:MAG: hypothetical protein R3F43_25330 [bacterium]